MGALFCLSGDQEGRKILFKGHIAIAAVIAFACLVSLGPGVPGAIGGALGGTAWAAGLLADGDAKALKAGLEAVDDNKPGRARSRGRAIKNPVGAKILLWARLTKPNPKADFAEISAFMAENPDWPGQIGLQRRAEEALNGQTPDGVVLAWFEDREALSGYGKARLGVLVNPVSGMAMTGVVGQGVTLDGRTVRTTDRKELDGARIVVSRSETKKGWFDAFRDRVQLEPVGSVAYKLGLVGTGQADATFTPKPRSEWDLCGGVAIILAGEGQATDGQGRPYKFNQEKPLHHGVVGTNGGLHQAILGLIR